jgi:hypothetical protein
VSAGVCPEHGEIRTYEFRGPWFRFDEAAAYVRVLHSCGCPNAKGFYDWRIRRGVIAQGNLVAKADIDAALRVARRLRRVS